MASSNHVTPTNCSWWPISAMDEDGKMADGEESEEPPAEPPEPRTFSRDRLVLYHWTQSFASQKVKKKRWKKKLPGWKTAVRAADFVCLLSSPHVMLLRARVRVCARWKTVMLQLQESAAASRSSAPSSRNQPRNSAALVHEQNCSFWRFLWLRCCSDGLNN